ncbi:MAG: hypothetical protein WCE21_05725 [Candidatus Babeliales bacterium]
MKRLLMVAMVSGAIGMVGVCQAANSAFTITVVNQSKGAIGAAIKFIVSGGVGTTVDSKDNITPNGGKAVLNVPAARPANCGDLYVRDESGAAPGNWLLTNNQASWICGSVTCVINRDAAGNFTMAKQ